LILFFFTVTIRLHCFLEVGYAPPNLQINFVENFELLFLGAEEKKMFKLIITAVAVVFGLVMFLPHSEVHDAKISRFVEDNSTFTPEVILEDPELVMHSIRKNLEDKLKLSSEHIYSLAKQKNKLQIDIQSAYGQAEALRAIGKKDYSKWESLTLEYEPIRSQHEELFIFVEELENNADPAEKDLLKTKKRELRDLTRVKNNLSYEIADINLKMTDLWWRIEEHEKLAESSSELLQDNLEQTKIAYEVNTTLQKSFFKAESVENAAAMAGKDSGLTAEGANKILDDIAEIDTIEELLTRQSAEILAINHPFKTSNLSSQELLDLIHESGF
tara:strand:+ start:2353 stop:3342 length:990 start_codon:yes stop_codon:yes gene_type:complete